MKKNLEREHFLNCDIAGFTYWDGAIAFENLKIGMILKIEFEPDNEHDPNAIALYYEENKLGYIPRSMNDTMSTFLRMGYDDIFEARINRIDPQQHPEHQVGIIVCVKSCVKWEPQLIGVGRD